MKMIKVQCEHCHKKVPFPFDNVFNTPRKNPCPFCNKKMTIPAFYELK